MVTFTRMKKISYFLISDTRWSSDDYDQTFYIIYNDTQWKNYGSAQPEELNCEQIFGAKSQTCRHILKPFLAFSVKVIAKNYKMEFKPLWRMEFGGLDYMEGDNYWPMDKIMHRSGNTNAEIPDERGKLVLVTDIVPHSGSSTSFTYLDDLRSIASPGASPTANVLFTGNANTCPFEPRTCVFGLSSCFWMQRTAAYGTVMSTSDASSKGFSVSWQMNGVLKFSIHSGDKTWEAGITMSDCSSSSSCNSEAKWMHVAAVWDKTNLALYVNGNHTRTDVGIIDSRSGVSSSFQVWRLLELREIRLWDYILSSDDIKNVYNERKIDFTITAMDDLGNWKTSAGCTETKDTGPCEDQSFQADPGDDTGYLEYDGFFVDISVTKNYICNTGYLKDVTGEAREEFPYDVAVVMGFTVEIDNEFNNDHLRAFKVRFTADTGNPSNLNANIYAAYSRNYDGKYQASCRSKNFRRDIYTGPITWSTGPWEDSETYKTPNLKDIVQPFFSAGKNEKDLTWKRYFFIIFEWKTTRGSSLRIRTKKEPNYYIKYKDKRPDKYIYADASNAPYPGYPLRYKTNPIIPRMKCLTFWYHMYGTGIGILSVSMRQQKSVLKEIFRLYGDQGNVWKNASVPLVGLNETSFQFQVIFTAIRGRTTTGDIAIDTIKFHIAPCSLMPGSAQPPNYIQATFPVAVETLNMPLPVFLMSFVNGLTLYGSQTLVVTRSSVADKNPTTDSFGLPLADGYFSGTVVKMVPRHPIQNGSDFTLSFQVRPESLTESTILWFGYDNITALSVSVLFSGNLSITLQDEFGSRTFKSSAMLKEGTWSYVAVVFSQIEQLLTTFIDSELKDEFILKNAKRLPHPLNIHIGGNNTLPMDTFKGHLSCVQYYGAALETHIIAVQAVCPNQHVAGACKNECKMEAVCDQIRLQCVCPPNANKYVNENCSNALESTIYNRTSAYASFDNKRQVQAALGPSFYQPNIPVAENDTRLENASYFFTNGPANLALCTAFSSRIRIKELESDCIVQRTCPGSFSLTYWVLMPSWQSMLTKDELTLIDFGILTVKFVENRTGMNSTLRNAHALIANVTLGGETCQWNIGQYQEFYGVWSHHVISVDATTNAVSVFYNGKSASVEKRDCFAAAASASPVEVYLGGGAPHICFDEVALWQAATTSYTAQWLYNSFVFAGYDQFPQKGINFTELTFNDETGSLWAVDVNNEVYFYHPDQYWMKIEGRMKKVSPGLNGIWAVDEDGYLRFRSGVNESVPEGSHWTMVPRSSYGSMTLQTVCSGYKHGVAFFIESTTSQLHCFNVLGNGEVQYSTATNLYATQIACSRYHCIVYKDDLTVHSLPLSSFVCSSSVSSSMTSLQPSTPMQQISTDSMGFFFQITTSGLLYRLVPNSNAWNLVPTEDTLNPKSVLSMNGQPVVILPSGKLKILEKGEKVYKVMHSGGLCMQYSRIWNRFHYLKSCDLIRIEDQFCIKSLTAQECVYINGDYSLSSHSSCIHQFTIQDLSTIRQGGRVLAPDSLHPGNDVNLYMRSSLNTRNNDYYAFTFQQASAFMAINSFYPPKKIEGVAKGELIYTVSVFFKFRDLSFYDNFRDITGIEAKFVHRKVEAELKQVFAESNSFVKVKLEEIGPGKQINEDCPFANCFIPLELKFNGRLFFSYLSAYEKDILVSDKFNGGYTDCQGNECAFQLDKKQRNVLINPANVVFVNSTSTSLVFRYIPRKFQEAHAGYDISYVGIDKLVSSRFFNGNFTLRDGLVFNVSNLQPNVDYTLTVTPLEIQNSALPAIILMAATLEGAPSGTPVTQVTFVNSTACFLQIQDLPNDLWNGILIGYRIYYAPSESVIYKHEFSNNESRRYNFSEITHSTVGYSEYKALGLQTFTNYVFYIAGFTNGGTGPFSRVECHTLDGAPSITPEKFNMSFINSSHVGVHWKPFSDDFRIWKTNQTTTRGYLVKMKEESYPRSLKIEQNINVTGQNQSHAVIGPLEPNRVYSFRLAAFNHIGIGPITIRICLKMPEGAPSLGIDTLAVYSNTSSTLGLTLGGMDIKGENGRILYYNISYMANLASEVLRESSAAWISDLIFPDTSSAAQVNATCNKMQRRIFSSTAQFLSCRNETSFLQPTANIINFTVTGLQYWTYYTIRASACSYKGCGPYNDSVYIRTDEHKPTCSSERISSSSMASTALNFSWVPLRSNCTHGYFAGYRLYFANASALSELFNLSNSFPLYNATLQQSKFFIETVQAKWSVEGLKKYTNYCIAISGSTVKGFGPLSHAHCATTLQDRPEGPPKNIRITLRTAAMIEISMEAPEKEIRNGIILGYNIYFSWKTVDGFWSNEQNRTVAKDDYENGHTVTRFKNLLYFTKYKFEIVAFTSAGAGNRSGIYYFNVTGESTPSAAPRNFTAYNISDSGIMLQWMQVERARLHGTFREFRITLNETLADRSFGTRREFYVAANMEQITPSDLILAVYNISDNVKSNFTLAKYDNGTAMYYLTLIGLKPYTNYSIELASCTTPGCGNTTVVRLTTKESSPAVSPKISFVANSTLSTELVIKWLEIPVLERNGVITGYVLRLMKFCDFLKQLNNKKTLFDCSRSLYDSATNFNTEFVSSHLLQATIGNLSSYTHYLIRIAAMTSAGTGPESEVIVLTAEDVPSAAPVITAAYNTSGKSIKLEWINIPLPYQKGILLGYNVRYIRTNASSDVIADSINCTDISQNVTQCEVRGLDLYAYYNFSIRGYTIKGLGPTTQDIVVRTGPYAHGGWAEWLSWSSCSKSCGGGLRFRRRECTNPSPWNGGDYCKGYSISNETCNTRRCSGMYLALLGEDCLNHCATRNLTCTRQIKLKDSPAKFEQLGKQCEDKTSQATWKQPFHPAFIENDNICAGFKDIPALISCNATPPSDEKTRRLCNCLHPSDIGFGEWTAWSYCTKSCGGGKQISRRNCLLPNGGCNGDGVMTKDCNTLSCPVDGNWGQWSTFSQCNKTCGYGYQHRYRKCDNPPPANGGDDCYGPSVDQAEGCNPQLCPTHGGWSSWEGTGACNQACGGGQMVQLRYCDNPRPEFGGKFCQGSPNKTEPCAFKECKGYQVLFSFTLIDFEWDYKYFYLSSQISAHLSAEIQANIYSLYKNAPYVSGVRIQGFRRSLASKRKRRETRKEHVIANTVIYYSEIKQGEVLYLQDYVTSKGKLFNLTITKLDTKALNELPDPPQNLTVSPIDPNTLHLSWMPPKNLSQYSNLTMYYVFYRENYNEVGQWNVRGLPITSTEFNITRLTPVTLYTIRMTVSITNGNGPATKEVLKRTSEGAPSIPPKNLKLRPIKPTQIYVEWDPIPSYYYHGNPLGYIVYYKNYQESSYHQAKVPYGASDVILKDLKPFQIYLVIVRAYTAVGVGPGCTGLTKTPEGVPAVYPPNVRVREKYSLDSVMVTWDEIAAEKSNGRLKGYKVKYTITKMSNVDVLVTSSSTKEIILDKYTFRLKITGLTSYTTYAVSVCGFTDAGNGPYSDPVIAETCKCPSNIFLNWYESRPYVTKFANNTVHGIFKQSIDRMVKKSCGTCNGIAPFVNYYIGPNGESPEKNSGLAVKTHIGDGYHITFPVFGRAEIRNFMDHHIFVLLVQSGGSAMIVSGVIDYAAKTLNALKSAKSTWPIVAISLLMSIIVGIMIWSVEQFQNEEFSRGRYIFGICQGLWWAFVSMTTVGYGDITPRTYLGKIIGMIWTLIGLVLTGILTGALTSTVTALSISPTATLYDTKTAVINSSYEYGLAVRRNAKIASNARFETAAEVLSALEKKQVDAALLDAFVTASHTPTINRLNLKVKKVIPGNAGFGFVLSKELVRLESDFRSHISSEKTLISEFVAQMTSMLEISDEKPPKIKLFDPKTPVFWIILKYLLVMLGSFALLGISWTVFKRFRKPNKVAPAVGRMKKFVDSFEDQLEDFRKHLEHITEEMSEQNLNDILTLTYLKKSLGRHQFRIQNS
ncbi:uncharacterized protein LOC135690773 [Rhopilema esculentum]|uniref:uncharacterized protein LOC135690773 n=1 Tax=Rhopilema esculentum TaxID=499914 RepID=UPI0031DD4B2E